MLKQMSAEIAGLDSFILNGLAVPVHQLEKLKVP
jgi:hypothetical protein